MKGITCLQYVFLLPFIIPDFEIDGKKVKVNWQYSCSKQGKARIHCISNQRGTVYGYI